MPRAFDSRPADDSLSKWTDEALLATYHNSGWKDIFDEFVHPYEGSLLRYLSRYLGDAVQAEDDLQNTLLRVYERSGLYRDDRSARS
jgi:DNA-directed RNA polymerase specialized sigma24 family protein